jgi:hypothetical protein
MNRVWMQERLERFKGLCETYNQENRASGYQWTTRLDQIASQINVELPTAREIVKNLDARLLDGINGPSYTGGASTDAVEQALGVLRDQGEWKANLAPDAPSLIADQFHPNVWRSASTIWDTGQFRSLSNRRQSRCRRTSPPRPRHRSPNASLSSWCSRLPLPSGT